MQKEEDVPKDTSKYKNDDFSIIDYNENDIMISKDELVILPYLKDDGFVLMKYQSIPAFSYKYKDTYSNSEYFLSCIRSFIDSKENTIQNVRKILYEETGLVLSTNVTIEVDKVLFKNNLNVGQYHFCLLNLSYNDYKQASLRTNDIISDPNKIRVVKISLGDLDEIKSYDLVTDYMILKFKYEINI
jgi:hypothetical protein